MYQRIGVALVLFGVCAWAFWQRCSILFADPYPLGIDGYFYSVQLRSLAESGQLYYPTTPLALWLMAPLALFTDPVTGAKLGAAAGGALLAVPVYFLGRRFSGGDRAVGVLAASLAVASAQSLYVSAEFVKSGIGLTVLATFLCALYAALDRPSRLRIGLAVAAFVATVLCHKLAAGLALMWAAPVLYVRANRWQRGAIVGAAVLAVAMGLALLDRNPLRSTADFTLPALAAPGMRPLRFGHETVIAVVLAVAALGLCLRPGTERRAAILGPAVFALVAAFPWLDIGDPQGIGFRLRVVTFLPLALLAAWLAGLASGRLTPYVRSAFVVGFAAGWILSRPVAEVREGVVHTHPAMQLAARAVAGRVPDDGVIITPSRQVMFMVTWYTRLPARLHPANVPPERRWRLLTYPLIQSSKSLQRGLARARAASEVTPPIGLHPGSINGLVLLPEATWQWLLRRMPEAERNRLEPWRIY